MKRYSTSRNRNNKDRFLEAISNIEEIIKTYSTEFAVNIKMPTPGRIQLLKRLIVSEISEIVIILKMIYSNMERLGFIQEKMKELQRKLPSGPVDINTSSGAEFVLIGNQYNKIMSELKICIKTLYEWLYHLKELIQSHPKIISLVSDKLWQVLQSHCEFRHKLITHKKNIQAYLMGGVRYSAKDFSIELLLTPFTPSTSTLNELNRLFAQCAQTLKDQEAEEKNYFERCKILYHNLNKFTDNKRKEIVSFIKRYGTISAQPVKLAEFIKDMAKDLIPKLAKLRD